MTGFPNYLQTDSQGVSYGLGGQMSNEAALAVQALNRRRAIANLLLQRGLAGGRGGTMAGRFYVPDSPLQGVANLFQIGVGAGLGGKVDDDQVEAAQRDQQMVADAVRGHQERMKQLADAPTAPDGVPVRPVPGPEPPPPAQGPYQGTVGAIPMPEPTIEAAKPGLAGSRPASQAGIEGMQGLDMAGMQPADMSQAAPPPPGEQAPPPPASPATAEVPPAQPGSMRAPRRETFEDLAELMVHQHPTVRAYAAQRAAMLQHVMDRDVQLQQAMNLKNLEHLLAVNLKRTASADAEADRAQREQQFSGVSGSTRAHIKSQEDLHEKATGTALAQIAGQKALHETPSGNALAQAADQVTIRDPVTGKITANQPAIDARRQIAAAGAARTQVNVDQGVPFATALQGELAKDVARTHQAAKTAQQSLTTIQQVEDAVRTGKVVTGPTAQPRIFMRQLSETLGITGKTNQEVLTKTRSAVQGMAKLQIDMSRQAQGQGAISDYERKLFVRASAGEDLTPPEIMELMSSMKKVAQWSISAHSDNLKKIQQVPRGGDVLAPFMELPQYPTAPQRSGEQGGALSQEEQQELHMLRKKYGR